MSAEMLYAAICVASLAGGVACMFLLLSVMDCYSRMTLRIAGHLALVAILFGISAGAFVGWRQETAKRKCAQVEVREMPR